MLRRTRKQAIALLPVAVAFAQSPSNPVEELDRKIQQGQADLKFDDAHGYLSSLLEALHIPVESQMMVFSKTSVQSLRIEPQNPRTLFFNDSVIVGWVRGGFIEVAAQDPQQGFVFYTVDQRPWVHEQRNRAQSLFAPRRDCLNCHVSKATFGIPGALIRSVSTGPDGIPLRQAPVYDTDQRTPFDKLWGGWYVTGSSGSARHMGTSVPANFDASPWLSPSSDIVALMVFEHQTHMMNLIARAARNTEGAVTGVDELVDYMLFADEPPLADKVVGTSGFAEKFAAMGPFDSKGRSLRQLDLTHRLMRYPCSYMIYTAAFDALPSATKDAIYRRMWHVLSARQDGRAIVEILRDTKKDLPGYFRPAEIK